ncbi:polysaccharide biosynthesis protein [Prochlorococcus marinus]|uniref:polysaccharide biosynthesis protein n=1 Tax=Prochlorococcus marinus TaxID=1219 RepID=UPI00094BF31F|nr:nucleoside-diphosphate sugar epimerase/dehydratase [Prochlorococcus marinus]
MKLKNYRRILIFIIDIFLVTFSLFGTYTILNGDDSSGLIFERFPIIFILNVIITSVVYNCTGQYKGLTRYVGSNSFYQIMVRNLFISILLFVFSGNDIFSYKFLFLYWILSSGLVVMSKVIMRDILIKLRVRNFTGKKVVIYGSGSAGIQLSLSLSINKMYDVIAFIDDDPYLQGRTLHNIPIRTRKFLEKNSNDVDQILLAIPSLKGIKRKNLLKEIRKYNIPTLQIPSIEELASGEKIDYLSPIDVEDLIYREKVESDFELLNKSINSSVVCVTGGAGSIGSELCRKILGLKPKALVIFDNNEHRLFELSNEVNKINKSKDIKIISQLGSATNEELVKKIFIENNVDIVFHAAAYKHVPIVEMNPLVGIFNNVFSTKVICKVSKYAKVKKAILISTDKAVRPTNVMGASKRLSEIIFQCFAEGEKVFSKSIKTKFSIVRFGNVLGSSGSVVPIFKKQIKEGGPITITHPDIIRYVMTISEAADLVIQSAALSKGGEIFLLDMGEPIKIIDLAKNMIHLRGLTVKDKDNPNGDIEISISGLRPGEKLYEELLIDAESESTLHPLIYKANERSFPPEILWKKLIDMEKSIARIDKERSLNLLKELVPEWIPDSINK